MTLASTYVKSIAKSFNTFTVLMKLSLSQALQPLQKYFLWSNYWECGLKASQDSSPQPQYVLYHSANIFLENYTRPFA